MNNAIWKWGIISGGVMVLAFLSYWLVNGGEFDPEKYRMGEIVGYTTMIISMLGVYFGIRSYRDKVLGGEITFSKALGKGALISLVASVIFGIYSVLLFEFMMTSDNKISLMRSGLERQGLPAEKVEAQLAQQMEMMDSFVGSIFNGLLMLVTVFLIGMVITLFSSLILRTKQKV